MALTPFTRVRQATVLALVEARRLDAGPADLARATKFLRQAEERLDQLPLLTSVAVRYGVACDAPATRIATPRLSSGRASREGGDQWDRDGAPLRVARNGVFIKPRDVPGRSRPAPAWCAGPSLRYVAQRIGVLRGGAGPARLGAPGRCPPATRVGRGGRRRRHRGGVDARARVSRERRRERQGHDHPAEQVFADIVAERIARGA